MPDRTSLHVARRVLAIFPKRFERPIIDLLSRADVKALLDAPDRGTCGAQRDAFLFAVLCNSGTRVTEVTSLKIADVLLERVLRHNCALG